MRTTIISLLCTGAHAFAPAQTSYASRRTVVISSTPVASEASSSASEASPASEASSSSPPGASKNEPTWEVKQHLYGLDMVNEQDSSVTSVTVNADGEVAGGEALPLPQTYITCGKCKSLFAIADEDLGNRGKGW